MKKVITVLLIIYLVFSCRARTIDGVVLDSESRAISDVLVKSSLESTISNKKGIFEIEVTREDTILFYRIGYKGLKIPENQMKYRVILEKNNIPLEGYTLSTMHSSEIENMEIKRIKISDENLGDLSDVIVKESNLINQDVRTKGTRQTVAIPGFEARHTLIMLDGIPLNSSGEAVDLSLIPLSLVDEIEVISGNLTGKAASGGMAALLNIRTREIQDPLYYEFGLESGSYNYFKTAAMIALKYRLFKWQFALDYQQGDNDFEYKVPDYWNLDKENETRENNSFKQLDMANKFNLQAGENNLEYKFFYTDFFRMLPGPVNNPELFHLARIEGFISRHQLQFMRYFNSIKFTTDGWMNIEESIYDNTRLNEPFCNYPIYNVYGESDKEIIGVRPELSAEIIESINGSAGIEFLEETYEYKEKTNPSNSIGKTKQKTLSEYFGLSIEKRISFFDNSFNATYRLDDNSEFDNFTSFSLRDVISLDDYAEIAAIYTNSYTLPSFHNLYWKGDAESVGNPDLLPEQSESVQLQGTFKHLGNKLNISWRKDKLTDMIDWVQTFTKAWKPINIASAEIENLEVSFDIPVMENINIQSLWNWTYSEDKTILASGSESAYYGKELIYTPDYNGKISLKYSGLRINAGFEALFTGSQWTTRDQLSDDLQLDSYEIFNAYCGYRAGYKGIDVSLTIHINNIENKFYQIYDYMPQPGRNYSIKIKINKGDK